MKLMALLNGGAAIALLAYLGNIAGKGVAAPDVRRSMAAYLGGLVLCGLAFAASYLTQLKLYNESVGEHGSTAVGISGGSGWRWYCGGAGALRVHQQHGLFYPGRAAAALRLAAVHGGIPLSHRGGAVLPVPGGPQAQDALHLEAGSPRARHGRKAAP